MAESELRLFICESTLLSEAFKDALSLAAGAAAGAVAGGLVDEGGVAAGGVGCVWSADGGVTELSLLLPVWLAQPAASSNTAAPAKTIFLIVGFLSD